jgi:hypothetical protein
MQIIEPTTKTSDSQLSAEQRNWFETIEYAVACQVSCLAFAEAGISGSEGAPLKCIESSLDCAEVCAMTARSLSRLMMTELGLTRAQLEVCAAVCAQCAYECELQLSQSKHFQDCAIACRRCEAACNTLVAELLAASA